MGKLKPGDPYYPKTMAQKLGYLTEEAGEVLAATGKSLRWGLESVNPTLPPEQQETNREWLLRELQDLKQAIHLVERALTTELWDPVWEPPDSINNEGAP